MHELSLAQGILGLVEAAAARERFSRVRVLHLAAGALAGVEVSALRFALASMAPGTCLDGARIDIDEPPGAAWCVGCQQAVAILSRLDPCPQCGSMRLQVTGGADLRVVALLVDDAPAWPPRPAALS